MAEKNKMAEEILDGPNQQMEVTVEVKPDTQDTKKKEEQLQQLKDNDIVANDNGENGPNSPSLSVDTVEPEAEKDAVDSDEDLDDIDSEDLESEDNDDIILLNLDADPQPFY